MNTILKLVLALAAVAVIGVSALFLTTDSSARKAPSAANAGGDDHGHSPSNVASGDEDGEQGHGKEPDEQEGQLTLSAEQIEAAGIRLATAAPHELGTVVSFPGEIRFDEDRTAHVVPRVPGVVESVHVNLGEAVSKGQVLAVIASQQISDLRSEQQAAQRRVELARVTFTRERQLWQEKISAEQDYLQARQTLQEAEIALDNARQKVAAIGATVGTLGGNRYELRAPFDATVVEKHLSVGEVVGETTNAFIVSDLDRVWATFAVPPSQLGSVMTGRAVKVSSTDMDREVDGKVGYVGSLLGEQNRAATVRVTLTNPNGAWRPGLFVNIAVTSRSDRVPVAIPDEAVQTVEDKPSVFVRTAQGFTARAVTLGRRDNGYVEVVDGLDAGTQIASSGSFTLKSELGKASAEHGH